MNTNHLKRFAQNARTKMLEQINARLEQGIATDSAELREKAGHLQKLQEAINKSSKAEVVDAVAYTWFNRLVALRFMDVNGYEPIAMQVVSPIAGATLPELLQEAKAGRIPEALPVNAQRIYAILDGKLGGTSPQNEAYRELLVGACNHLSKTLPFLFEKIDDYAELLLPDDLISEFSILQDIKEGMTPEDCTEVEIIGWLYQFYISEKKDEVFADKGKVKKEDIPAATQLFTPRWIVEYMVQNTVGKLWLQNNPKSSLREHMPYFIESPSVAAEDYLKIDSVEDITLLDQACGSGHILVYGFELLSKIYEEEGYNESEIPQLIIEKNLYGFEIDTRAAQLAGLALMLKARQYYRRVFKKDVVPNIVCYQDLSLSTDEIKDTFKIAKISLSDELLHDLTTMQQATNFGSLIIPHTSASELEATRQQLVTEGKKSDLFGSHDLDAILRTVQQLSALSRKYHCVVDNPPYMGRYMNKTIANFVKVNYPFSKTDLMACFMESGLSVLKRKGFLGMINQHSWMFLSSYEKLRKHLIETIHFDTMLHLGPRTFPEIGGEVVQNTSFTFWNKKADLEGKYVRLVDFDKAIIKKRKTLEAIKDRDCELNFTANQKQFKKIPGLVISGYRLQSERIMDVFEEKKSIESISISDGQNITAKNDLYLRFFWEPAKSSVSQDEKWMFYAKGGAYRKWWGNLDYVVDWSKKARDFYRRNSSARIIPEYLWYKFGITWTLLSSSKTGFRILPDFATFDKTGSSIFLKKVEDTNETLALLNSKVSTYILRIFSETTAYQVREIRQIPKIDLKTDNEEVETCINVSEIEWNSRETSWDFQQNELIRIQGQDLEEAYDAYCQYWRNQFFKLHKNEEELNRQFINIYGLQDELTPDVPLEDITILKDETLIKNGELVFRESEIMAQFISYAVGCMFGRYSLDQLGLILANQGETLKTFLKKIQTSNPKLQSLFDLTFVPDDDNVIPILYNEWFEDDIVARFYAFLKASFGAQDLERNLAFVEQCIGKDIRKYFLKDFYKDHIKRYKKRPIYWQFSAPSGAFNVLIYMHRYTPDTLNEILNGYLTTYEVKLKSELDTQAHLKNTGAATEQTRADKEIDRINKVLLELKEYKQDLFKLATARIPIDLDDGVLVNYNKFGNVIKEVSGLNDKKAKAKVKKFDWIDVSEIR